MGVVFWHNNLQDFNFNKIIAMRSRASNTLDCGPGPEFESRQGMANNIYSLFICIYMAEDHEPSIGIITSLL